MLVINSIFTGTQPEDITNWFNLDGVVGVADFTATKLGNVIYFSYKILAGANPSVINIVGNFNTLIDNNIYPNFPRADGYSSSFFSAYPSSPVDKFIMSSQNNSSVDVTVYYCFQII